MDKEQFENHLFFEGDEVLYRGKPCRVMSRTPRAITIHLGGRHYKTVLPVEIELIDGDGVETR